MLLGVVLALVAAVGYNSSPILLALAARSRREHAGPMLVKSVAQRGPGMLGIGLSTAAWLCEVLALTRISLTLDKIVMTAGFALLLGLSAWGLREPVGRREIAGAILIGAGIAAVGLMPPERGGSVPTLPQWLLMVGILSPVFLVPSAFRLLGRRLPPISNASAAGLAYALAGLFNAGLAALLTTRDSDALLLLLGGAVAASLFGFMDELHALQEGHAARMVPVIAALQTIVPILFAPFFFSETWPAAVAARVVIAGGILLSLIGVVILSGAAAHLLREAPETEPAGPIERERA